MISLLLVSKALDDYTVEYTLTRPEPYWNSKTTNSILFPVNEEFLKSKEKRIWYLDAKQYPLQRTLLVKDFTSKSSIEYVKNPHYYDHDKVTIEKVKLAYFDGSDQEMTIRNLKWCLILWTGVYPNSSNYAKTKEKYQDNMFIAYKTKHLGTLTLMLTVKLITIQLKQQMNKRNQLKQQF